MHVAADPLLQVHPVAAGGGEHRIERGEQPAEVVDGVAQGGQAAVVVAVRHQGVHDGLGAHHAAGPVGEEEEQLADEVGAPGGDVLALAEQPRRAEQADLERGVDGEAGHRPEHPEHRAPGPRPAPAVRPPAPPAARPRRRPGGAARRAAAGPSRRSGRTRRRRPPGARCPAPSAGWRAARRRRWGCRRRRGRRPRPRWCAAGPRGPAPGPRTAPRRAGPGGRRRGVRCGRRRGRAAPDRGPAPDRQCSWATSWAASRECIASTLWPSWRAMWPASSRASASR